MNGEIGEEVARLIRDSSGVVRVYQSSIHPSDIESLRACFVEDVRPAFLRAHGCNGIELAINSEVSSSGMVEGAAISTWDSIDAMEEALASRDLAESQIRIQQYLRSLPLIQTYAVIE